MSIKVFWTGMKKKIYFSPTLHPWHEDPKLSFVLVIQIMWMRELTMNITLNYA